MRKLVCRRQPALPLDNLRMATRSHWYSTGKRGVSRALGTTPLETRARLQRTSRSRVMMSRFAY